MREQHFGKALSVEPFPGSPDRVPARGRMSGTWDACPAELLRCRGRKGTMAHRSSRSATSCRAMLPPLPSSILAVRFMSLACRPVSLVTLSQMTEALAHQPQRVATPSWCRTRTQPAVRQLQLQFAPTSPLPWPLERWLSGTGRPPPQPRAVTTRHKLCASVVSPTNCSRREYAAPAHASAAARAAPAPRRSPPPQQVGVEGQQLGAIAGGAFGEDGDGVTPALRASAVLWTTRIASRLLARSMKSAGAIDQRADHGPVLDIGFGDEAHLRQHRVDGGDVEPGRGWRRRDGPRCWRAPRLARSVQCRRSAAALRDQAWMWPWRSAGLQREAPRHDPEAAGDAARAAAGARRRSMPSPALTSGRFERHLTGHQRAAHASRQLDAADRKSKGVCLLWLFQQRA